MFEQIEFICVAYSSGKDIFNLHDKSYCKSFLYTGRRFYLPPGSFPKMQQTFFALLQAYQFQEDACQGNTII